jgi:leucyl aminopeptidase (aminopeptidase T)
VNGRQEHSFRPHEFTSPLPVILQWNPEISRIVTAPKKPIPTLTEGLKTSITWLSNHISEEGALLSIGNNTIISLKTNKEKHVKLLDLAAGPRGLKLTEFAIGVTEAIATSIDYKINSQLNEGISGVHLAIGDGSSGYHIDFLSPAVNVSPTHWKIQ